MNFVADRPIFICGYPKSGTTLLVSLLDGHSKLLVIPEESKLFSKVLRQSRKDKFDYLFEDTNIGAMQKGIIDAPSGYRDYSDFDFDLFKRKAKKYYEQKGKHPKHLLESVAFGLALATKRSSFDHWVEKTPQTEYFFNTIQAWWPETIIIMMVRDPRQAFSSHRTYQDKKPVPSKISLSAFIWQWWKSVESFKAFVKNGGKGLMVTYERLTKNPRETLKKITNLIGIELEKTLFAPTRLGGKWEGNPSGQQSFGQISNNPKNYNDLLTGREIRQIERNLGYLMKRCGYEFDYPASLIINNFYRYIGKR